MHVASRVILILAGLALAFVMLLGMAGGGVSWSEAMLGVVPLTVVVLLALVGTQTARPSAMPAGSPPALRWRKGAGIIWGVLGVMYFGGLGGITAIYSQSEADSARSSAEYQRQQARDARNRELSESYTRSTFDPYDPYGYRTPSYSSPYSSGYGMSSTYEREADYAESRARRKAEGVPIGWGFAALSLFPLVGFFIALGKRSVSDIELQQYRYATQGPGWGPQPGWGPPPGYYGGPPQGWQGAPQGYPGPQGYPQGPPGNV